VQKKRKKGIEIRREVREDILRMLWLGKRAIDFKEYAKRNHHRPGTVYEVRRALMDNGIVARDGREYVLVPDRFRRKGDVLRYVEFLKSDDPSLMETGAEGLHEIYTSRMNLKQNLEDFLKSSDIQALIEGQDVISATKIKEAWEVFVAVLNEAKKFDWLLDRYLIGTIQGAITCAKSLGKLESSSPLDHDLNEALVRGAAKTILELTCSEAYVMHKRGVVKLFKILRDLDDSNTILLSTVEELLKRPYKKVDFSKLERPLFDEERPSKDREYDDIWHEPWGYSDLFEEICVTLKRMGKRKMKTALDNWMAQDNSNLRHGAWVFRRRLSQDKRWLKVSEFERIGHREDGAGG
jgi:hypothetical protein